MTTTTEHSPDGASTDLSDSVLDPQRFKREATEEVLTKKGTTEQREALIAFKNSVMETVRDNLIPMSRAVQEALGATGETYDYETFRISLSSMLSFFKKDMRIESMEPNFVASLIDGAVGNIPRVGGMRTAFRTLLEDERTRDAFIDVLRKELEEPSGESIVAGEIGPRAVGGTVFVSRFAPPERGDGQLPSGPLSLRRQEPIIDLVPGFEEPDSSGVVGESVEQYTPTREEKLVTLSQGLADGDLNLLTSYARAKKDIRISQKADNGDGSRYHQQIAGKARLSMSAAAQLVADQYERLYNS